MEPPDFSSDVSRRRFIQGAALTGAASVMTGVAAAQHNASHPAPDPIVQNFAGEYGAPVTEFVVPKRPMGKTCLNISILGMGGYHLGTAAGQPEVNNMVAKALDHGINFFDNAWEYHKGTSEERVGTALKANATRPS